MTKTVRNVLIVLGLAAIVAFLPGGGRTANFIAALLNIAIGVVFVLLGARFYRENRVAIYSLGDRNRLLLYSALGAVVVALAGRQRMLGSGIGIFLWFLLVGGAAAALFAVWQSHRSYGGY